MQNFVYGNRKYLFLQEDELLLFKRSTFNINIKHHLNNKLI